MSLRLLQKQTQSQIWLFQRRGLADVASSVNGDAGKVYHPLIKPTHAEDVFPISHTKKKLSKLKPVIPKDKRAKELQIVSRHVLRGILRECTYFPDDYVGAYIRQHVLTRFRTYQAQALKKHRDECAFDDRMKAIRRKGRQTLYQLQRANAGDRDMMLKALSMTYGRSGKRRRDLMSGLLPVAKTPTTSADNPAEDPDANSESEAQLIETLTAPTRRSKRDRTTDDVKKETIHAVDELPSQLKVLVESQIRAAPPMTIHRNPKRLSPVIPDLNSWHRPMPEVRVINKLKQWYAHLLSLVQPPLPDWEWHRLHDLATGATPPQPLKPRRKAVRVDNPPTALELVVMKGKVDKSFFREDFRHEVTPRFMRRVYAEVFAQCPLMEYESEREAWKVTWGCQVLPQKLERVAKESSPLSRYSDTDMAEAEPEALVLDSERG